MKKGSRFTVGKDGKRIKSFAGLSVSPFNLEPRTLNREP
jgi:hypothetical protein